MAAKKPEPHVRNKFDDWADKQAVKLNAGEMAALIRDLKSVAVSMDGDHSKRAESQKKLAALLRVAAAEIEARSKVS